MKNNFSLNFQYYFSPRWGIQAECCYQKASYFCHLEWYGQRVINMFTGEVEYIKINHIDHIEKPYTKTWSIYSIYLIIGIYKSQNYRNKALFPYMFAGVGISIIKGDKDYFLDRSLIGPETLSFGTKLGGGLKYHLTSKTPK